jgi:hypothetical protein
MERARFIIVRLELWVMSPFLCPYATNFFPTQTANLLLIVSLAGLLSQAERGSVWDPVISPAV